MQRINTRTVLLNNREMQVKERFEELLSEGLNIPDGARQAIEEADFGIPRLLWLKPAFVSYLSENTLRLDPMNDTINNTKEN